MKLRTITIKGDEAAVIVENHDYVILYEADIEENMFTGNLQIEGAYDIVGLDGNTRIQDITYKEEMFIEQAIERKWDEMYNYLTKRNLERQKNGK